MADSEETKPAVAEEGEQQQQEENTPNGDVQKTTEGETTAESEPQVEASGEQQAAEEPPAQAESAGEETHTAQEEQAEAAEEAAAPQEDEQQQQQQEQDIEKAEEQSPVQEAAETNAEAEQQAATGVTAEEEVAQIDTEAEAQREQNSEGEQTEQTAAEVHENGVVDEPEEPQQEEAAPQEAVTSELSDEDKERCRHLFDKKATDGRLNLKGFKYLFRLMGQVLSTEDAENMFQEGVRDENGTIDFDEFCRLFCKFSQAEQERKDAVARSIEKLFPTSDAQPVELKKVESLLMKLQKPDLSMRLVREKSDLGQDDVRRLVKAMDKQGNGLISKHEFVETLCGHLQM